MMQALTSIELTLGEVRRVKFRIRRSSDGSFFPVQMAEWIRVEAWVNGEPALPPVYADRESGVDDWLGGLVTIPFSPLNVTARARSYSYHMVAKLPGEEPAWPGGTLEVRTRSGLVSYPLPGTGAFSSPLVESDVALSAVEPGMPVEYVPTAGVRASNGSVYGVTLSAAATGYTAIFSRKGSVTRGDWTSLFGQQYLPDSAPLYLGPAGTLVAVGAVRVGTSDASGTRLSFPL